MDHQVDAFVRFTHVLFGIVWIGHLYFFNLANLPVFNFKINNGDPAQKAGPNLMHRALWWFRWGAMATLVSGLILLWARAQVLDQSIGDFMGTAEGKTISWGMLLGIIMWFNVWFIIWPNQKVVLGNNLRIAKGVPDDEKKRLEGENAPRVNRAKLASRINFWLSIPMLLLMVFAAHAPLFN